MAAADWAMLNGRFFRWKRRQGHTPNEQGVCRDNQEGDGFFHELERVGDASHEPEVGFQRVATEVLDHRDLDS